MTSPFASYANATLRFQVASGALAPDAKGNLRPGKAIVQVEAMLQQKRDPNREVRPGVDSSAVWVEGYIVSVLSQDSLVLPSVVTPDSVCSATWQGRQGRFFLEFTARNPYIAAIGVDLVEKMRGYFQFGSFVVGGEPWTPSPPPPTPSSDQQQAEADSPIVAGQPLYLKPNGHAGLASASSIATARLCGLAITAAAQTVAVTYSPDGILELPDWNAIVDSPTLIPGQTYFLSTTTGKLTLDAPTDSGLVVAAVGTALSETKLAIEIQPIILL